MGNQLNSKAHRLGISEGWDSAWPPGSSEKDIIHAENEIREFVKKFLEAKGLIVAKTRFYHIPFEEEGVLVVEYLDSVVLKRKKLLNKQKAKRFIDPLELKQSQRGLHRTGYAKKRKYNQKPNSNKSNRKGRSFDIPRKILIPGKIARNLLPSLLEPAHFEESQKTLNFHKGSTVLNSEEKIKLKSLQKALRISKATIDSSLDRESLAALIKWNSRFLNLTKGQQIHLLNKNVNTKRDSLEKEISERLSSLLNFSNIRLRFKPLKNYWGSTGEKMKDVAFSELNARFDVKTYGLLVPIATVLWSQNWHNAELLSNAIVHLLKHTRVNRQFRVFVTIKTILKYFFQKFDGIEGIRIQYKGRLRNRPRYSRSLLTFGKIPSQTINHPLAYHENKVVTSVGVISVKVWIFGKVKI